MKEKIAKFHRQVVEPINIEVDEHDLQWFKRNIQAQALQLNL